MKKGLTGAQLKWIATITMLIDHIGAIIVSEVAWQQGINLFNASLFEPIVLLYWALRLIGRLSFTLYAFLLVEGFVHTRNKVKYSALLFVFFLISEIPFDLALHNAPFNMSNQNIFLTLFLGVLMMSTIDYFHQKGKWVGYLIVLIFGIINEFLMADYGFYGILLISLFYLFKEEKVTRFFSVLILGLYQMTAGLSILFIDKYNGLRGKQPKYFFYLFYPLHLLVLYWIIS